MALETEKKKIKTEKRVQRAIVDMVPKQSRDVLEVSIT